MFGLFKKKPEAVKPDASVIVPRIKHTNFLIALRDIVKKEEDMPATDPFVADLLITYAFDLPEQFQMVCARDVKRLNLSPKELRDVAVDNLKRQIATKQIEIVGWTGAPSVSKVLVGDNLEACLLLVDGFWQSLARKNPTAMVVGAPTRDVLLFTTDASSDLGLQLLRSAINEAYGSETTHALTQQLLVRRDEKWEVFVAKA